MAANADFDVPAERVARRRASPVRKTTLSIKRLSKRELLAGAAEYPADINAAHPRPRTLAECDARALGTADAPCPYVSCRHHLALDVSRRSGSVTVNFPDREPDELAETCSLRVAARGGLPLEEIATLTNLTRERVRQLEARAVAALRTALAAAGLTYDALEPAPPAPVFEPPVAPAWIAAPAGPRAETLDTPWSAAQRARAVLRGGGDPAALGALGRRGLLWAVAARRRTGHVPAARAIERALVAMRAADRARGGTAEARVALAFDAAMDGGDAR